MQNAEQRNESTLRYSNSFHPFQYPRTVQPFWFVTPSIALRVAHGCCVLYLSVYTREWCLPMYFSAEYGVSFILIRGGGRLTHTCTCNMFEYLQILARELQKTLPTEHAQPLVRAACYTQWCSTRIYSSKLLIHLLVLSMRRAICDICHRAMTSLFTHNKFQHC